MIAGVTLSQGCVLHIEGFKSEGFDAADKFLFIIGLHDKNTALAFVVTSQVWNLELKKKEIVVLAKGSVSFLPKESYIQCFCLHKLDVNDLQNGGTKGTVKFCGNLGRAVLQKVLDVVADSDLLSGREIQEVFAVLRNL